MRKIDLSLLKEFQEIPKLIIKPIKLSDDRVYFAKIVQNSKQEEWVDGIYCYYIKEGRSERIDKGVHSEYPYKYDIFIPYSYEDIQIYESMNYIFYSIVVFNDGRDDVSKIIIYAIDIDTHEQIDLFVVKYSQKEFYYMGFRMLSDKYMAIDLVNTVNDEIKEYDKLFILDIYTRKMIEIHDLSIKYSVGMFQLSKNSKYIFCEEVYMSEDDEVDILESGMYEEAQDDLSNSRLNIFKNSIKYMIFEDFKDKCANLSEKIDMTDLDVFLEDGILRVIGSTKDYIYYRKSKHQKKLEKSKDFIDRIMIGKEEIYSINKNDLSISHIANLEFGSTFSFEDNIFFKINEIDKSISIISLLTGKEEYKYIKEDKSESFVDFIKNRYLIISLNQYNDKDKYLKIIDIYTNSVELSAKDINIIGNTIFYESLK